MISRIERLLNVDTEKAKILASKISQRVIALESSSMSKKKRLKTVLKELGWSNKNIEHLFMARLSNQEYTLKTHV